MLAGVLTMLFFTIPVPRAGDWKLKAEKSGIKVYSQKQDNSAFDAIRAVFEAEATLEQFASVVLNIEEYEYWNTAVSNVRLLKRISDSEFIYYTETKAPWPVTDRYLVVRMKLTHDVKSKALKITLDNVPDMIPEKEGFVRVKGYHVSATVVALSESRLKADYCYYVDPGGDIPAWVTNMASINLPVSSLTNLKSRIKAKSGHR